MSNHAHTIASAISTPPFSGHVHHMVSVAALAQAVAALVGALPAISTIMGIFWFLLVFPSTVTEFVAWCRRYIHKQPNEEEGVEILNMRTEIEILKAEVRAWQSFHNTGENQ